jgi:hypothetical protein
MISTAPSTPRPEGKPKPEEVEVFLAIHQVEDLAFAKVVQEAGEHLADAVRLGAPEGMALMQQLLWQNAEFDRLAITRYFSPDEKGRIRFLRLEGLPRSPELFAHVAHGVLFLQTAHTLNDELWEACMALRGTPEEREIRARAVFLSGGILVIPKEALEFEAFLRFEGEPGYRPTKDGEPPALGVVLVPSPSRHQDHV